MELVEVILLVRAPSTAVLDACSGFAEVTIDRVIEVLVSRPSALGSSGRLEEKEDGIVAFGNIAEV